MSEHDGTREWEHADCSICGGARCGESEFLFGTDGERLHYAWLRFIVVLMKVTRIRDLTRWLARRLSA